MIALAWIKRWSYVIGGVLFAALGVLNAYYRHKSKRYKDEADVLKATVRAERLKNKIKKEKKEELSRRESEIKKGIKNEDLDDLFNNDDW